MSRGREIAAGHFALIKSHFEASGNEWSTRERITGATGLSKNAFMYVAHRTHRGAFEKRHQRHGSWVEWRLREGAAP
jgi:hypothetical protein